MALVTGELAPEFEAEDIHGRPLRLSDFRGRKVMLAFFRFIACPFCNLRVHELTARLPALKGKLEIIAVFQSPKELLLAHANARAFDVHVIGDPDKILFQLYEGQLSTGASVAGHLRHVPSWIRGVSVGAFSDGIRLGDQRLVPAEILIDEDGVIRHAYYGKDITDHLPLREVMRFARVDTGATKEMPKLE